MYPDPHSLLVTLFTLFYSSGGKRGASPPAPDPMPSPKRQRLEQEVKSRPTLKEMLKRPVAPQLDSETDDIGALCLRS